MGRLAPDRPERRVGAELVAGLQFDGTRQFVEEDVSLVARLRPAQARKSQLGSRRAPNRGSPADEPRLSCTALGCPPQACRCNSRARASERRRINVA